MGISLDASTPAPVDLTGSTATTVTTASFSPPSGSLVTIVVYVGFSAVTSGAGPTVTVKDSDSVSYTAGPAVYDGRFDGAYIFTHYYASAPGSVTVTATRSVDTGQSLFGIKPYVLDGAAASQAGAGSATNFTAGSTTTITGSITTTTTGSWPVVGAAVGDAEASFTPSGLSTDHSVDDTTDGCAAAAGHAITGASPGATTLGWTVPGNASFAWAALEILPASGTSHTATAALTVTPVFSVTAVKTSRNNTATAALTVTPVFSATRTQGHTRSAALTVTPRFSVQRSGGVQSSGSIVPLLPAMGVA